MITIIQIEPLPFPNPHIRNSSFNITVLFVYLMIGNGILLLFEKKISSGCEPELIFRLDDRFEPLQC